MGLIGQEVLFLLNKEEQNGTPACAEVRTLWL